MIFSHFSDSSLKAYLNYYGILIPQTNGTSQANLIRFRDECLKELQRRTDNV